MNENELNVWIGFDPRERAAYDVAKASLKRRASVPVGVRPLKLATVAGLLTRPIERREGKMWCPISEAPMATEFAVSRFCVPFLQGHKGWALFCDCDVVFLEDVAQLFALADPQKAVLVVKHEPAVKEGTKMDGQIQTVYARKNWSSVVLWNCEHPDHKALTVEALNGWPGRDLHAFKWLPDESIGSLPAGWNHLVGIDPFERPGVKLAHFTLGGPWLPKWEPRPGDDLWLAEARSG